MNSQPQGLKGVAATYSTNSARVIIHKSSVQ